MTQNTALMSDDELRRMYVLAHRGQIAGQTAADLDRDQLEWAIQYNERTLAWLADADEPWRWDSSARKGLTAREVFRTARKRDLVAGDCRVALRALRAEAEHRRRPAAPEPAEAEPVEVELVTEPEAPDWRADLAERLEWTAGEMVEAVGLLRKRMEEMEEELTDLAERAHGLDALASQLRRSR